jgi:hypothetical protein
MRFRALMLIALTLPLSSLAEKAAPGAAPEQAAASICNPSFELAEGPNDAGTAFVLASPLGKNKKLLMTAHHLFGPDGGVEPQISWQDLPDAVSGVTCQSAQAPVWRVTGGRPFAVKDAKSYAEEGPKRDLAVFAVETAVAALPLAAADPKVGDVVWLVARARSGAVPKQLLHKARVVGVSSDQLIYAYENKALGLSGSSGAPVVNALGQVVAVNFGGGESAKGEKLGFGTARGSISASLAALAQPVAQ